MQQLQLVTYGYQNFLQYIISMRPSNDSAEVTIERRLDAAQQKFESFAVIALCSQYPQSFLP